MARHIKIADISEAEGLFHVIDAETHCGVGQSFEHGFEAEAYLVDQGFLYDPATDTYCRR